MASKEVLRQSFELFGCEIEDENILEKSLELCFKYDLNEEQFVETWLAFILNNDPDNINPTQQYLNKLESDELKAKFDPLLDLKKLKKQLPNSTQIKLENVESDSFIDQGSNEAILRLYNCTIEPTTPKVKRLRSPEIETPDTETKVRAITSTFSPCTYKEESISTPSRYPSTGIAGKVLLSFGPDIKNWKRENDEKVQIVKSNTFHVPRDAMYMFDILLAQKGRLAHVCEFVGKRLCDMWTEMTNGDIRCTPIFTTPSQSKFRTWGRIAAEQNSDDKSILLEGYTNYNDQPLILPLNFNNMKNYSVFPGQVVAVECTNPIGDDLLIEDMFSQGYVPSVGIPTLKQPLNLVVASGPFTTSSNLNYQPLWDLIGYVIDNEPHVLILIGPFIDYTHASIQDVLITQTFDELFKSLIDKIMQHLNGKNIQLVLVSSNRDAHHEPVFPTPEYSFLNKHSNLHVMPDPCILDVEGVTIGLTSVDSLKHLGSEEISKGGTERLPRLANHLLSQACFYPLYPPSSDLNVDVNLWERYAFFDIQPHIMILPSDLRFFCKVINGCLILNPERLHKFNYARLCVQPAVDDMWSVNNISCEIVKV